MQNKKTQIYLTPLLPSAIGAVLYTFMSAMIIILNQFSFIQQYLQIPDSVNFTRMFLGWVDRLVNGVLGEGRTQVVVVGLFWAAVGLAVYIFLRGLAGFIAEFSEGVEERRYLWPRGVDRNQAMREVITKGVFRFIALIGLAMVVLVLIPREISGPVAVAGLAKPLQYLVWFILLWFTMHLSVVLMRLIALKPRLFG